jgi:hypothetical protein
MEAERRKSPEVASLTSVILDSDMALASSSRISVPVYTAVNIAESVAEADKRMDQPMSDRPSPGSTAWANGVTTAGVVGYAEAKRALDLIDSDLESLLAVDAMKALALFVEQHKDDDDARA